MAAPVYRSPAYRRARAGWSVRVAAGGVTCHLCSRLIVGAFDLDHVRGAPDVLAPTHPGCNRAEGARYLARRRLTWHTSAPRPRRG